MSGRVQRDGEVGLATPSLSLARSVDLLNAERPSSRISLTQGERTEVDVALSSSGAYRGAHARWLSPLQVRAQQQQRAQKSRRERDGRTPQRRLELEMSPTLRSWQ